MKITRSRQARCAGFTLLELLTVMVIMLIVVGISLGAYLGFMRSTAMTAGINNVRGIVNVARHFAATYRRRSFLVFLQEPDARGDPRGYYYVCAQEGSHVGLNGATRLEIETPRWAGTPLDAQKVRAHNFTKEEWGVVVWNDKINGNYLDAKNSGGALLTWDIGDRCGIPINDREYLPPGIVFGDGTGSVGVPEVVVFNPDGTTEKSGSGSYVIELLEWKGGAIGEGHGEIRVTGLTGLLEVTDGRDI